MNRYSKLLLIFVGFIVVAFAVDYYNVTRKERLLSHAVAQCGGQLGSIPVWPIGAEYRITLTSVPDTERLEALSVANHMRGWVGIAFKDCIVSHQESQRIMNKLPQCHLFIVRDGEMVPLNHLLLVEDIGESKSKP